MNVGAIVVRSGWAWHPEWMHLARHGRVLSVHGAETTVEWQAGRDGNTKVETVSIDALHCLWWRSA